MIEIISGTLGFRSHQQSGNSILTVWMSSIMPHTLRLLSQWTYTEIKPGNVEAFLPNSTAPSLNTPTIPSTPAPSTPTPSAEDYLSM